MEEEKPQYWPRASYLEHDTQRALVPNCAVIIVQDSHVHSREPACLALLKDCFHLSHSSPAVAGPSVAMRASHPGAGLVRSDQTSIERGVSLPYPCKYHLVSHREIESYSAQESQSPDCSFPL